MVGFIKKTQKDIDKFKLTRAIELRTGKTEPARGYKNLHASDLTKADFCPRKFVLVRHHNVKLKDDYISTPLRMTFDEGNDKQARINNDYLGDTMWGFWHCNHCYLRVGFSKRPALCTCGAQDYSYDETFVRHTQSILGGNIDGIVELDANVLTPIEIKIMAQADFIKLKAPLVEHRIRTKLYLHLIENAKQEYAKKINHQKARILYVQRGFGKKGAEGYVTPFKEFVILRDDEEIQPLIDMAARITQIEKSNKAPEALSYIAPQGICSTITSKCALKCPVRTQCFQ